MVQQGAGQSDFALLERVLSCKHRKHGLHTHTVTPMQSFFYFKFYRLTFQNVLFFSGGFSCENKLAENSKCQYNTVQYKILTS